MANEPVPGKQSSPTLGQIIEFMECHYPSQYAEEWDRVGLVIGERSQPIQKILLAVDPVEETVAEAIAGEYDLLLTHHPLYLRGTSFLSSDDAKGRMVRELILGNCALYCAHTNGDVAPGGVADSLAQLLGLEQITPLVSGPQEGFGAGRVGAVRPQPLREFAEKVANRLPAGPTGILVGGDPEMMVQTVAVSGGAGDSFLEAARLAGADVFVTADLRHHPASEHLNNGKPALICGSHWATEWPWLPTLSRLLNTAFAGKYGNLNDDGFSVEVSKTVTEPWSFYLSTRGFLE